MQYKVVTVTMDNMGEIKEGRRKQTIVFPAELQIGGLYFLRPGKLYKVVEVINQDGGTFNEI